MNLSSDWMNTTDYVESYTYFFPAGLLPLEAGGAITAAGRYWNSLTSPVSFSSNIE